MQGSGRDDESTAELRPRRQRHAAARARRSARRSTARSREHGDARGAGLSPPGLRYTYAELGDAVDQRRAGPDRARRSSAATGSASGRPTAPSGSSSSSPPRKIGAILVNVNPAYRGHELEYALHQSGRQAARAAPGFRAHDYRATLTDRPELAARRPARSARGAARAARSSSSAATPRRACCAGTTCSSGARPWHAPRSRRARPSSSSTTRSTSSTPPAPPASPRAPRSATTTSSTTATSSASGCGYTERDRLCIPVPLYHCFGMVLGNLACVTHGAAMVYPAESFDPLAMLEAVQAERCTALHGVPTMFIAELDHAEFDALRPLDAAHRDHGRLALPGRGDEAGQRRRCTWPRSRSATG